MEKKSDVTKELNEFVGTKGYQESFKKLMDAQCMPTKEHYAIPALQSIIDRIRSRLIIITGFSISEDEFPTMSINWNRKVENGNK